MKFDVITLFPGMFESPLGDSILKRATEKGQLQVGLHQLRNYTHDKHHVVDDTPYGGGSGMVMKPDPVAEAIEAVKGERGKVILLSPAGKTFNQNEAKRLSKESHIVLVCGRYEGIDERVNKYVDETLSIGDFVMTGGEIAAMAIIDSVARLLPGVLGCEDSAAEESFSWDLLEYPHYTRPKSFRGEEVPEVLTSGNHEAIRLWRRKEALKKTLLVRPDLIDRSTLGKEDLKLIAEIEKGEED
ncbi:MAG: tRNA (guanosine(37)-N1)-methyltransferase TrmD [Deltaproteobacteria bacterium]|nr:tRNA (guanosine(37)-N1)-methyltransferase TrmD [Deltaproteobacteria bacterium]